MVPDEGSEKLCKPLLKRDFPEFLKMSCPQICPRNTAPTRHAELRGVDAR